ncbi:MULTISPECIES: ABC transporter permease [Pararhodobacter]|uniref:ABC transporter permease n=1 Tax=Pararhodobacter aggregans TaxID=404875 RepID=A0A2T7UVE6_9RHOB|nr:MULTISPECIES: ABC transporter permease [Pararhodobacter]PTX03768.1 nucleoside ABC transporter membrane protein [Pararhodobacter aggregans]PVE48743.1 ABC transporter permease [Pararhodobacter aggregans]
MDFGSINPVVLIASLMVAATPILLAAIGELVVEKAGVLNLGVEGMMIVGAVSGFAAAVTTGSPILGMLAAIVAGAAVSLIFALLTQVLMANQVASGLALTLFGLGFSALLGQSYVGIVPPRTEKLNFGFLSDLPVVGRILFGHDILVYVSLFLVAAVWYWLNYTRGGRVLRAVGENHDSAHALGYKVKRVRILAILFGGACAGLGGAYLSLVRVPQWTEGMTAGAGWIALALVVFASWKPWRVLAGAYLFGGIMVLQLNLQAAGYRIPVEYLAMSPYIITILVLVVMSSNRTRRTLAAPGSLGRSFHAAG